MSLRQNCSRVISCSKRKSKIKRINIKSSCHMFFFHCQIFIIIVRIFFWYVASFLALESISTAYSGYTGCVSKGVSHKTFLRIAYLQLWFLYTLTFMKTGKVVVMTGGGRRKLHLCKSYLELGRLILLVSSLIPYCATLKREVLL